MTDSQERVVTMVGEFTGFKLSRIHFETRIAQDTGMDGDDAVEFFEKFAEDFHVDLTVLYDHWDQHFVPEGFGVSPGWFVIVGISTIGGGVLHEVFSVVPMWAFMIALLIGCCWIWSKFFFDGPETLPVTVRDLVDAAHEGKWVKHYEPYPKLFRAIEG